jgi:uncharacterized protein YjiS (DUF1127 family)
MSCGSSTFSCATEPRMTIARPAIVVPSPFGWMRLIGRMYARWQQRQNLRDLDDRLLRDIGITRHQAEREASKPFWK